jgi:DNA-binding CsgD family transcriptional regulator/tetratricopeptide (TPR) repeat protein
MQAAPGRRGTRGPVPAAPALTPAPLRGRDGELAVIGEQLAYARRGRGTVLLAEGRAGSGKTRLLAEAAAMAARAGFRVGMGAVAPGDQVVPMGGLVAALFDGREPLIDPGARHRLHYLPEQRYWLLEELESLLEEAALASPVLVCIDDLRWEDSGSLTALRTLPPRLADLPVAWLVSFRPGQDQAAVRAPMDSLDGVRARRLLLGPLDGQAVAEVIADILGAAPDSGLLELAGRAHGIPFLLVELLRGLREEDLVRVDSGRASLVAARLPARVTSSMRDRLSRLSEPARQAALVASVLGRRFSFSHLSAMLARPPSALLAEADELLHADLLVEDDGLLAYRHDLIREAVRDTLPPTVRRALQRQAVDAMLAAGSPPVEVAAALAASAEPGDRVAVRLLREAARALGPSDPGAAADLSRRALELASSRDHLRGPLTAETALLLHAAGRIEQGRAFADEALREALAPGQEAEVRLSIAWMMAVSADARAEAGRRALAVPGLPAELRARHLARILHNLASAGRQHEARELLGEAREAVRVASDADATFTLALSESSLDYASGSFGPGLARIEAVRRQRPDIGEPARELLAFRLHAELLAAVDRYDESLRLATGCLVAGQQARQGWAVWVWEGGRGCRLLQVGRLGDAAAALEPIVAGLGELPTVGILDAQAVVASGRVAMHTGNAAQVRKSAVIARALLQQGTPAVQRFGAWLMAMTAMWEGDAAAALAHLCALGGDKRLSIVPLFPLDVTDEVLLARIAVAAGDARLATSAAAAAGERARLNPGVASIAGAAAHAEGLVLDDTDHLAAAVKWFEQAPRPLALASALEDAGKALAAHGDREEGLPLLGRALELYARAGASWDAGRVRRRLRALGVHRRLAAVEPPPRHGWSGLTQSELDVVRLVAQGLTNRQTAERLFLSPHTVSNHLRHAFTKLDISSRVELARLAATHDGARG